MNFFQYIHQHQRPNKETKKNMSGFKKQQLVLAESTSLFMKRSGIMDRFITYCGAGQVDYVNKCFNAEVNDRVSTLKVKQQAITHIMIAGATTEQTEAYSHRIVTALMTKFKRCGNVTKLDMTTENGSNCARFLLYFMKRAVVLFPKLQNIVTNESHGWILRRSEEYIFYAKVSPYQILSMDEVATVLRHSMFADDRGTLRRFSDPSVNINILGDIYVCQPQKFAEEDGTVTLCYHYHQYGLKAIRFVLYQLETGAWKVRSLSVCFFANDPCDRCI